MEECRFHLFASASEIPLAMPIRQPSDGQVNWQEFDEYRIKSVIVVFSLC